MQRFRVNGECRLRFGRKSFRGPSEASAEGLRRRPSGKGNGKKPATLPKSDNVAADVQTCVAQCRAGFELACPCSFRSGRLSLKPEGAEDDSEDRDRWQQPRKTQTGGSF